jgi:hypothetical protein
MGTATIFRKLKIAVAFAAMSTFLFTSVGAAQTTTTGNPGPFVVALQTPSNNARIGGNTTFTGAAVDCGRGIAATRVAVYDGVDRNGTYIGDASIDTSRSLARYCSNLSGNAQIGFTMIYSSRTLRDGPHTLAFVAEFPGGGTSTLTTEVIIDNYARNDRYNPFYGPRYGYGLGYGNYYGGYGYGNPYYGGYGYGSYSSPLCYGAVSINYYTGCGGYGGYYGHYQPYGAYVGGYMPYYGNYGYFGTQSPYSITSCTVYNCGGGIIGNTGCVAAYGAPFCGYYGAYAYPYANYNYGVYVTGPGYNPSNCAYYYISYTGCYGTGYNYQYGQSYITLNQAGQSVRIGGPVVLSGFATCSTGGVTTVTLTDRTGNGNVTIGTAPAAGSFSIQWTPAALGTRIIQVTATGGTCGTFSQSFAVTVTN